MAASRPRRKIWGKVVSWVSFGNAPACSVLARPPAGTRLRYLQTLNTLRSRPGEFAAMTATPSRIQGVLSPVLTPFNADYTPDADRFIRHCRWLLAQEVGLA